MLAVLDDGAPLETISSACRVRLKSDAVSVGVAMMIMASLVLCSSKLMVVVEVVQQQMNQTM